MIKPWESCDYILNVLTESGFFDFEDPDAFLNMNDLYNNPCFSSIFPNTLQENIIPLPIKRDLPDLESIIDKVEERSNDLIEKLAQIHEQFSFKVHSPTNSVGTSSSSALESPQNTSTHTMTRKRYNLRSQIKQQEEDSTKKRKSLAEDTYESSTDTEDMTFDPDSDIAESRTTRSKSTKLHQDSPSSSNTHLSPEKKRRKRTTYNKQHIEILKQFIFTHDKYPYPTEEEKQDLLKQINFSMTKEQLETWFVNHRKRFLPNFNREKSTYSGSPAKSGFNKELEKKLKEEK